MLEKKLRNESDIVKSDSLHVLKNFGSIDYADETNMTKSTNFDSQADDIILSWSSM